MVQGCTQIINIGSGIRVIDSAPFRIAKLLRRCISSRTKCSCIRVVLDLVFLRCTEINQFHAALRLDHNIRRFHIPVDNRWIHVMQIIQGTCKLQSPFYNQFLRLCAFFFQTVLNRIAFDVIHYNVDCSVLIDDIYDSWQYRMIYILQDIRFSFQSLEQSLRRFFSIIFNLFDCPLFIQTFITGKIYDRHTTAADFRQYFIFSV